MTVTDGIGPGIATVEGTGTPNYQALARKIVDGLDLSAVAARARSDPGVRGDLLTVTRCCMEAIVAAARTGAAVPERAAARVEAIAARWADRQLPVELVQHAVHAAAEAVTEVVVGERGRPDVAARLHGAGVVLIEALRTLSTAVVRGYVNEVRAMTGERRVASQTLVSALLTGRADAIARRHNDIELAEHYLVVAVALAAHPDEQDPRLDAGVVARRKLRRVQAELAREQEPRALALLSVDGGTVLVPADASGSADDRLHALIDRLSRAADAEVTAAFVPAPRARIPEAADRAHQLLDLALRLGRGPGLHRFRELACEYQLVQPGPANRHLRSLLDPLQAEPELVDTVDAFFAAQCKRESAARRLGISVSAVRRRLDRITALTGLNPDAPTDLWYLRASFVARMLEPGPAGGPL
ncbi:PucR family transcriptional regulator [Nocardia blacklockiae]|uniref:PucR family transcriptional regulator n=1 Tax=Nocardia blacklockiae TaxID=480036 RepID=UPI0018962730|nr:helix-turn-helix domain-containing protein [Nocardia blacklockiae]MBF6175928.1 helix-turn-helix domain-containing protein [Nocardia blacklockiae]